MDSAVGVLKQEYSTLSQSHNFISIDCTFGESGDVREVTSPANVCSDPMTGRDVTWGQHIRVPSLFVLFYSSTELHPVDRLSLTTTQNKSKDAV